MEIPVSLSIRETQFKTTMRHYLTPIRMICFLLFAILYIASYFIITRYKRKSGNPSPRFGNGGHAAASCVTDSWDSVGGFSADRQRCCKHGVFVWYRSTSSLFCSGV
uniref:Uncharacterized protein n=1 Tax=Castor canadensis TaxID=51338 RepID=A0A8C0XSF3_CASCN